VEAAISEEVTWAVETFEHQPRDEQAPGHQARARLRHWWNFFVLASFGGMVGIRRSTRSTLAAVREGCSGREIFVC
jgi:hypothetical protein